MLRALPSLPGRAVDRWGRADLVAKAVIILLVGGTVSGLFDLLLLSGQPLFLRVLICINLYAQVFLLLYAPSELRKIRRYGSERRVSDTPRTREPRYAPRAGDQPLILPGLLESQAKQDASGLPGTL